MLEVSPILSSTSEHFVQMPCVCQRSRDAR